MASRYSVFDRVRIKFGRDRGHYGTIRSVNGDDGTYYGVKLDCHEAEMGYSEYELEIVESRGRKPLWKRGDNPDNKGVYVPKEVAACPECQGELCARAMEWESQSGRPTATGIELDCMNDMRDGEPCHRWHQSDWKPVRDAISQWCDARAN